MPILPTITPIYAAIIALLFVALSARVIAFRRANRLSLGDEGNKSLLKRMRAQANCAEYAPIGLILLLLMELMAAPGWLVHGLGISLVAGRVLHAYGFSASPPIMPLRVAGMLLTLISITLSAVAILLQIVL